MEFSDRKWNDFSRPLIKTLVLQHRLHFKQGVQNWFSKWEMELFKQEMELFPPLPGLWSNNSFYNIISISTKEFQIDFQNRKWNHFSSFQASVQKTSFTTSYSYIPRHSKLSFKTGIGIIQTGKAIIFPTFRPLIEFFFQCVSHFYLEVQHWFSKQEVE